MASIYASTDASCSLAMARAARPARIIVSFLVIMPMFNSIAKSFSLDQGFGINAAAQNRALA